MELKEFAALVSRMREAQERSRGKKDLDALRKAQSLERQVDEAIDTIKGSGPTELYKWN